MADSLEQPHADPFVPERTTNTTAAPDTPADLIERLVREKEAAERDAERKK